MFSKFHKSPESRSDEEPNLNFTRSQTLILRGAIDKMKRLSQSGSSNFFPELRKNALISQSYFSNFALHMIRYGYRLHVPLKLICRVVWTSNLLKVKGWTCHFIFSVSRKLFLFVWTALRFSQTVSDDILYHIQCNSVFINVASVDYVFTLNYHFFVCIEFTLILMMLCKCTWTFSINMY